MTELVSFVKKIADIFKTTGAQMCYKKKNKRLNFPLDLKI